MEGNGMAVNATRMNINAILQEAMDSSSELQLVDDESYKPMFSGTRQRTIHRRSSQSEGGPSPSSNSDSDDMVSPIRFCDEETIATVFNTRR